MNQSISKGLSKVGAGILTAAMSLTLFGNIQVSANVVKSEENTGLGTTGLHSPVKPKSKDESWHGSFVYFGSYEGNPIRFRVLDTETTEYGGRTMFLDSTWCLFNDQFDPGGEAWNECYLNERLNGEFLRSSFTQQEQNAIALSTIEGGKTYPAGSYCEYGFVKSTGLSEDKIFLLDAMELLNEEYGYSSDESWTDDDGNWESNFNNHSVINHSKFLNGNRVKWRLRSASGKYHNHRELYSGTVWADGLLCYSANEKSEKLGVAPAMNINLSSVIFTTAIDGEYGALHTEYTMTLVDKDLGIMVETINGISVDGRRVTVPYSVLGNHSKKANQASVLILDKEYTPGNTNNANILYYRAMSGTFKNWGTATGTFTLPESLKMSGWGKDYHIYILSETLTGDEESDYASVPVEIYNPEKYEWIQDSNGWRYRTDDDTYLESEWKNIGGNWYYFDDTGYMATGWVETDGKWYYCNTSGAMQSGWVKDDGTWYYLGSSGAMMTGWQKIDDRWYYLGGNGAMRKGWQHINSKWYYFDQTGAMTTGWKLIDDIWYYFGPDGDMKTGWQKVSGNWYYLSDSGSMYTGWLHLGDDWYYLMDNGVMATGQITIEGRDYIFNSDGVCTNPY
ncbi:MAG: hypothetical protein K5665_10755 [Saccharofermentans sp.]|nr:hypothetical protein [Saccharofermentans sp.]